MNIRSERFESTCKMFWSKKLQPQIFADRAVTREIARLNLAKRKTLCISDLAAFHYFHYLTKRFS